MSRDGRALVLGGYGEARFFTRARHEPVQALFSRNCATTLRVPTGPESQHKAAAWSGDNRLLEVSECPKGTPCAATLHITPLRDVRWVDVASVTDDAEESVSTGLVRCDSSDLELGGDDKGAQVVAVRFAGVPLGAEDLDAIADAWLLLVVDEVTAADSLGARVQVRAGAVDNSAELCGGEAGPASGATSRCPAVPRPPPGSSGRPPNGPKWGPRESRRTSCRSSARSFAGPGGAQATP